MKKRLSVGLVILINAILLAVIVSVVVAMNFPDSSPTEPQKQPAEESHTPIPVPATESSVLEIVNKERAKVGVAPLKLHPDITKSAQLKADDMWDRDYRSHYPPGNGSSIFTPAMRNLLNPLCNYSGENFVYAGAMSNLLNPLCNYSGENFVYAGAGNVHTAETSMNWWMNSPPHKQAILDPKYTLTGIGVSHGNIVVQHFCEYLLRWFFTNEIPADYSWYS